MRGRLTLSQRTEYSGRTSISLQAFYYGAVPRRAYLSDLVDAQLNTLKVDVPTPAATWWLWESSILGKNLILN